MKIPYFCCIGAELKRYAQDFDFMNQVYLYKVPTDDSIDEVLSEDYFKAISNSVLQDDIIYIYEASAKTLHECRFDKQNGHITAVPLASDETLTGAVTSIIHDNLTPNKLLKSDENGKVAASEFSENDFVKVDGSSIMTGPLKMRSSISFKCAIAPSWDGVGFYKLNDNDSLTLMASMETTDGLCPATNNTYNLGKASHKWKDAYIARVITAIINNGSDIAVPVTNTPDTLALKSQVDLAANSGSQLYTTGVWYAKMYAASTVPTGAEYNGRNYADFSQVDNDNNPIIVIYEGQSGAWVETDRITPPAEYNGYVTITSKIWDIAEQTDQQGGEVLWSYNQKTFTPYPKIVSLLNQANTDLSNLTDTGANIANWSNNVTNCITEIPQDINLGLNAGTLTLKAGSKVYFPNGSGVFDTTTIANDLTATNQNNGTYMVFLTGPGGTLMLRNITLCYSGTTAPTPVQQYSAWYDTANNIMKYTGIYTTWSAGASLPIALVTVSGGEISSIDQVFNGFGYIGKTVFALPGVKGLSPDGRNADGTLKNNPVALQTVLTYTGSSTSDDVWLLHNTYIGHMRKQNLKYDAENNVNINAYGAIQVLCPFASSVTNAGVISNFKTKPAFHAVDYNDFATLETSKANTSLDNVSAGIDFVVESQFPTAENDYTWYRKYKSGWVEQGGIVSGASYQTINLPIAMADTNYTVFITDRRTGTTRDGNENAQVLLGNSTTTKVYVFLNSNVQGSYWEVKGMAAS